MTTTTHEHNGIRFTRTTDSDIVGYGYGGEPIYRQPAPPRTATTTVSFKKLADGTWGIQGIGLVSGQTVTVTKRSGETSQVVVGEVTPADPYSTDRRIRSAYDVATIARTPQVVVTAEVVASSKVTEEGFYLLDGQAYKVIGSRDGSFHYARLVTGHGLKKAPGMYNRLTPAMKMTPEQIAAYGVRTQVCVNCSTPLTDPASQGVGLGTKCGPDILGSDVYRVAYKAAKVAAEAAQVAADAAAAPALADREADEIADLLAHFGA